MIFELLGHAWCPTPSHNLQVATRFYLGAGITKLTSLSLSCPIHWVGRYY
jgi:hypothetical protein